MKLIALLCLLYASTQAAVLNWDVNPPEEYHTNSNVFGTEQWVVTNILLGYRVHWGTTPGYYESVFDVGNVTSLAVPDSFGRVYYSVTAYDTELRESEPSDEIFYDWPIPSMPPSRPMNLRFTGTNALAEIRLQQSTGLVSGGWQDTGIAFVPMNSQVAFFRAAAPGILAPVPVQQLRFDGSKRGKL